MNKNYGIQQIVIGLKSWVAGLNSPIPFKDMGVLWKDYLGEPEKQRYPYFDSQGCVSYSHTNCIEAQCNYYWTTDVWSEQSKKDMIALGLVKDGKFNFSDRFLAKASDTQKNGNTGEKVADTARTMGYVGQDVWPVDDSMTWETYYAPITQEVYDKAKLALKYFSMSYEWVITGQNDTKSILTKQLKHAPVQVFTPLCNWADEVVNSCGKIIPEHAYMIYDVDEYYRVLDQYERYQKKLALDYYIPWGLKLVVVPKNPTAFVFTRDLSIGMFGADVKELQKVLGVKQTGFFWLATRSAVIAFQLKHNIRPSIGYFGKLTRKALMELSTGV